MSKMRDFIAFRALLDLLKEKNKEYLLDEVYEKSKASLDEAVVSNFVKDLYDQFTEEELSAKIAEIVTPKGMRAEVEVVYQTVENLHKACPNHLGDWYFTGNYPTPGGNKVVNKALINFMEGLGVRAY
jgi:amidophosphoribosyltransferase